MQIAGIVAEYNPFHNGPLYQIKQTKKETGCDYVIVIMSGNFSQRGTPTICHKFARAQMALQNGADLVLELPVPFATSSAENFAHYSISGLHQTHIIDTLSFGSELGQLDALDHIAELIISPSSGFEETLRTYLKEGLSFPRAREKALLKLAAHDTYSFTALEAALTNPNNILGIEYLKALKRLDSPIRPFTVHRIGTGYHDDHLTTHIASATAIRKQLSEGLTAYESCMPPSALDILKGQVRPNLSRLMPFIHFKLMFSKREDLYALWDIPKQLLHSLINACHPHITYEELVDAVTSKTYTRATVSRSLLRILLAIQEESLHPIAQSGQLPYLRVLGCRKEATSLLKHLITNSEVPVITNFAKQYASLDPLAHTLLNYEIEATKLYHYLTGKKALMMQDFTTPFLLV